MVGYMLPVYEGPVGNYLAAVAVLAVSWPSAAQAQALGGLLIAGTIVLSLALLWVDQTLSRLLTPPVVQVFLFVVIVIAL